MPTPGIDDGGQYMPRGFWDEAPVCEVLKVTRGGELVIGTGLMGGIDVPDVLF